MIFSDVHLLARTSSPALAASWCAGFYFAAEDRLSTGSLVRELELKEQRLRFTRLTGAGPELGWVSIRHWAHEDEGVQDVRGLEGGQPLLEPLSFSKEEKKRSVYDGMELELQSYNEESQRHAQRLSRLSDELLGEALLL